MYEPTFPSDPNGVEMTLYQIEGSKLRAPNVTIDDFFQALARIKPSVSPSDLERQVEFTNNFGQDG